MVQWSAEYLDEATKGDVMAMVMVGEMYLVGWGTFPQNRDEAIRSVLSCPQMAFYLCLCEMFISLSVFIGG